MKLNPADEYTGVPIFMKIEDISSRSPMPAVKPSGSGQRSGRPACGSGVKRDWPRL